MRGRSAAHIYKNAMSARRPFFPPTRFSLPTKISKTTPCKVAWWSRPGCFERSARKHFDTSGKSAALFHHRAICKTPRLSSWRPRIFDLNSTSRGPIEVVSEMHAEFPHVVLGAVYEARLPATEIWQPQHIQSGRVNDAAIVLQLSLAVEDPRIQPGIVRAEAGRPYHRANVHAQRESERR